MELGNKSSDEKNPKKTHMRQGVLKNRIIKDSRNT